MLEPEIGKLSWHSQNAEPGIYVIIEGKVRLIDRHNDLLVSLKAGGFFGELTLFSDSFQSYSIRASANTRLCHLKKQLILSMLQKYSAVQQNLARRAKLRDLLLLNHRVNHGDETLSLLRDRTETAKKKKKIIQLTFGYQSQSEVNTLENENISFEVLPGQTVALVGCSDSGKTTISKMGLGFYALTEGKILLDGYDVTSLCFNFCDRRSELSSKILFYLVVQFAKILA